MSLYILQTWRNLTVYLRYFMLILFSGSIVVGETIQHLLLILLRNNTWWYHNNRDDILTEWRRRWWWLQRGDGLYDHLYDNSSDIFHIFLSSSSLQVRLIIWILKLIFNYKIAWATVETLGLGGEWSQVCMFKLLFTYCFIVTSPLSILRRWNVDTFQFSPSAAATKRYRQGSYRHPAPPYSEMWGIIFIAFMPSCNGRAVNLNYTWIWYG